MSYNTSTRPAGMPPRRPLPTVMAGRGRRPGGVDTRAEIIAAARAVFREQGYAGTSMRAIARRAAVDPALVHHYFTDKAHLFIETMALPLDPRAVQEAVAAGGFSGERLVERFLAQWEQGPGPGSPAFVSLAQAMAASRPVADGIREFVAERVLLHGPADEDEATLTRRRALIGVTAHGDRLGPLRHADGAGGVGQPGRGGRLGGSHRGPLRHRPSRLTDDAPVTAPTVTYAE